MATIPASKIAGEELAATEVNKLRDAGYIVDLDAGETINGATLPVAIYIDDTTNEVYACDGDDQDKLEFIGFAISNSTDGNAIQIQNNGIVAGFTGLDIGKKYYVQDDKTIGTAVGTIEIEVGIAISATQILITKGLRIKSGALSDQTGSPGAGATVTDDEVITVGFRPKLIILYGRCKATAWGQDWYNKGVIFGSSIGAIFGFTGSNNQGDTNWQSALKNYGTSIGASKVDSNNGVTTTFTLYAISATGFTVRTQYVGASGAGGSGAFDQGHYVAIG